MIFQMGNIICNIGKCFVTLRALDCSVWTVAFLMVISVTLISKYVVTILTFYANLSFRVQSLKHFLVMIFQMALPPAKIVKTFFASSANQFCFSSHWNICCPVHGFSQNSDKLWIIVFQVFHLDRTLINLFFLRDVFIFVKS